MNALSIGFRQIASLGVALATLATLAFSSPHRLAPEDSCSTEEGIFWGALASNLDWQTGSTGEQGALLTVTRDKNPSCLAGVATGSTSHIRLNGITLNWVEVGWEELFAGTDEVFTEWGINRNSQARDEYVQQCLTPGVESYYRTRQWSGNQWQLAFACYNGASWQVLRYYTTLWASGIPAAETWRFGDNQTGMSDTQDELYYRSGNAWNYWFDMFCFNDFANGWQGSRVDHKSYKAIKGSSNCPLGG